MPIVEALEMPLQVNVRKKLKDIKDLQWIFLGEFLRREDGCTCSVENFERYDQVRVLTVIRSSLNKFSM